MRAIMKARNGWCTKSPAKAGEPSPCKATWPRGPTRNALSRRRKKPSAASMYSVFSFAPFEQFSEQEFHRQFNTNVLGMFLMIEAALPAFGAEGGSIINIGSEASVTAYPTLSIYVASKSAVNGLTRLLSKEFGSRKIRVNALNPGGTETEGAHAAGVMGTESKKQIIASTPLGRVGQPEDIARVAVFLASDDAGWLTGEIIFANGGKK